MSWWHNPSLLHVKNDEGTWDRVRKEGLQPRHIGYYDDHLHAWYPVSDEKRNEVATLLGDDWRFDGYYGAFFPVPLIETKWE